MKLNELQTVYYLLRATQFRSDRIIPFNLIVDYNGKLITADFLKPDKNSPTRVREERLDYDLDPINDFVNNDFFANMLSEWRKSEESNFFNADKAFSNSFLFLKSIINFVETLEDIPHITNHVYNLKFLESNVSFKNAFLSDTEFQIVSIKVN